MLPDIFNDVLGPVMRGPSSSHVAKRNKKETGWGPLVLKAVPAKHD